MATHRNEGTVGTSAVFHGEGLENAFESSRTGGPSIREVPGLNDTAPSRKTVALLIDHRSASWIAIRRATEMSNALDARLHVALAIPGGTKNSHPALIVSHVADLLNANSPRHGFEIDVVEGPIGKHRHGIAVARRAALVVVDARFGSRQACKLADDLSVPVLVARDSRPDGDWIAASALRHLTYPVLRAARSFSRVLGRELVYFHNAKPTPVFLGDPMAGAATYTAMLELQDDVAAAKRARLARLAATEPDIHGSMARGASTVDSILALAREREADVIVVGHRPRSWFSRLLGSGTAEEVVDNSRRSVVIVPLAKER